MKLFILLLSVISAHAQLKTRVQYQPVANMLYQLDCVSTVEQHCGTQNYRQLWDKEFLKTEAQRAGVDKWRELRFRLNKQVKFDSALETSMNDKVLIAALQGRDLDDYLTRLDLLMRPRDRDAVEQILKLYWPAFQKWWVSEALTKGKRFAAETDKILSSNGIQKRLKQYIGFYQARLPENYTLTFNLMYRPNFLKEASSGQQIQNYSRIEFFPDEAAADRMDVVIHELCHFLYRSADENAFHDLKKRFQAVERATSMPAYNLMDEALATALGNGLISRDLMTDKARWQHYLARDKSFYNDEYIDRAAKALLPWLDKGLGDGLTLYDSGFVPGYIDLMDKTFGADLTAPAQYLREVNLVTDFKEGEEISRQTHRAFRSNSIFSAGPHLQDDKCFETYNANPALSTLFLIRRDSLGPLAKRGVLTPEQFRELHGKAGPLLYARKRTPQSWNWIVIAEDINQVGGLLQKLAALKSASEGLIPMESPH